MFTFLAVVAGVLAGAGAIYHGVSAAEKKAESERIARENYQKQLWSEASDIQAFIENDLWSSLDTALGNIEALETEQAQLETNMPRYEEWLSNYEGMLAGEDNVLTQEREGMIDAVESAENALADYTASSALQVRSIFDEAYSSVHSSRQQQALANVSAGATGSVVSSYTAATRKIQSDITRFVGADGYINEETGEGELGTFARTMIVTRNQIDHEMQNMQANIDAANLALTLWNENTEDQAEQYRFEYETGMERLEGLPDEIEKYKAVIKNKTDTALAKIKDWEAKRKEYGTSQADIDAQKQSWKELYAAIGVELAI